ncbi:MAG TPA: chromate transporter [Azonexus sp.]|nr:chromate transporter [Azonexus sp.]
MTDVPILTLQWTDWLGLFLHYLALSALAVGGVITTAPEMHRYLVDQQHWLSQAQFESSIAIAQAAPGPNIMFVALMGWNLGLNAGGSLYALLGVMVTMTGILLPSTTLTYLAARWGHQNRDLRSVRAFKLGMGPIVISLLCATGWLISNSHTDVIRYWPLWLLTAVTTLVVWRTRLHLLWLIAMGALLGWFGLV